MSSHTSRSIELSSPPLGRLYEVDGRHLLLHRSGSGEPPVVFLPGAGMVGLDFLNIHSQVSQFTTSVLYDRAGTGWSDQVGLPRRAAEVSDELRGLLHQVGVPAPYLLVGHSLGGAYARRYAQLFPDEVAGLLLLEPDHEDFEDTHLVRPGGEHPGIHAAIERLVMQQQSNGSQGAPKLFERSSTGTSDP